MEFNDIKRLLTDKFGEAVIVSEQSDGLQPSLTIKPELIAEVCLELRDNEQTYFDFLSCLSGVDYGEEQSKIGVVYHLSSIPFKNNWY